MKNNFKDLINIQQENENNTFEKQCMELIEIIIKSYNFYKEEDKSDECSNLLPGIN